MASLAQRSAQPMAETNFDITQFLSHAQQRLDLDDGTYLALFVYYGLNRLETGDPYEPVLRYLHKTGSNQNVFRLDADNRILWRIPLHYRADICDPFIELFKQGDAVHGYTSYGIEYRIDLANGDVTSIAQHRHGFPKRDS